MLFKINTDTLKRGISLLRNTLAKDSPRAVTKHYFFDLTNNLLTIKSTNSTMSSIWTTQVASDSDVSFTIPGDTFTSLLATLRENEISFEYFPETKDVKVICGNYVWDASSGNVSEYPAILIPSDLEEIVLPTDFQGLLRSVFFSISNDLTKLDLSSLCFDLNKEKAGKINLLSTDRARLSCASFEVPLEQTDPVSFLIPRNSLSDIMKFEPSILGYTKDLKRVYFTQVEPTGTYTFITILANTVYPNIYVYLSGDFTDASDTIKINRQEFTRALKRTLITSDKSTGRFVFKDNTLSISTLNEINTSKSKEVLNIEYNQDTEIAFSLNVNYLLDYLGQESLDVVSFRVLRDKCLIFDKSDYRHVLSINPLKA